MAEELVQCAVGGCKNTTTKIAEICDKCYEEYIDGVLFKENGVWYHKY
jgi:(p)ppGpp synthase/HD superfamily hydrolase